MLVQSPLLTLKTSQSSPIKRLERCCDCLLSCSKRRVTSGKIKYLREVDPCLSAAGTEIKLSSHGAVTSAQGFILGCTHHHSIEAA